VLQIGRIEKDSEEITLLGLQKHPSLVKFVIPLSALQNPQNLGLGPSQEHGKERD
jgi:hypothetical protein